jgi:hypothetical protein
MSSGFGGYGGFAQTGGFRARVLALEAWRTSVEAAWVSFTPALTAAVTDPTLGTGNIRAGRYKQIGRLVAVRFRIVFGSAGVAAGSGTYRISLPVLGRAPLVADQTLGAIARLTDASAPQILHAEIKQPTTDYVTLRIIRAAGAAGTGADVTNSNPWTWAANDELIGAYVYESDAAP